MSALGDSNQVENEKMCYDELLRQIKKEHQAKAKEFIPKLCCALQNEDPFLSNEDITERIKKDLISIWSRTTIYENIPNEFKNEQKRKAAKMSHKKSIEESATPLEQKVLEESSGGTTIFERKPYQPQEAETLSKKKDVEINESGQKIDQLNQVVVDKAQIDQEKEDLKKQVEGLKLILRQRSIMFHSEKFKKELRACIRYTGYYEICFDDRMEITKIGSYALRL
ncbi:MAG TPA: hypothetical protein VH796_00205 [Nitrososphaeraceae archaeon]|jgi:hypothetical protein